MEVDPHVSPGLDVEIEALTVLGSKLIQAILDHEPAEKIEALIDTGAPLWYEESNEGGISPLHAACFVENDTLVKLLIDKGAVWNAGGYLSSLTQTTSIDFR